FVDVIDDGGLVLYTERVEASSVSWAPHVIAIHPNIEVAAGHSYTLRLRSTTTSGCYGFEYNDANPYAAGSESYSTNGGLSFTSEPARDLKFTVDVKRPDARDAGATADGGDAERGGSADDERDADTIDGHDADDARPAADAGPIEEHDADGARDVPSSSDAGCSCDV